MPCARLQNAANLSAGAGGFSVAIAALIAPMSGRFTDRDAAKGEKFRSLVLEMREEITEDFLKFFRERQSELNGLRNKLSAL